MRSKHWVPALGLTPAEVDDLNRLATAARRGRAAARNQLFARLAGPIGQMTFRRRRLCRGLEPDEVTSETFLALADLLDAWPGDRFDRFFQEHYGRCLWRRLAALRWPGRGILPLAPWHQEQPDPEAAAVLAVAELAVGLTPAEGWLLLSRLRGASLADLATRLGVSRRTLERRWRAAARTLRAAWPSP
jgi:DNA-directed RNA polymerase specialized sigma24 family protein